MNKYALRAQEHWQRHAPIRYAALQDPESYFTELGESAASQVDQMASAMEAQVPQDLPYLERVGQFQAIRMQAEEAVMAELVYSVEAEASSLSEELEAMLGDLPTPIGIMRAIDVIREDVDAQTEGSSTSMTLEQEQRIRQLETLLPLVTLETEPDEMSEPELRDRILALKPFWNPETRSLTQL